ncbi:MAG: S8 family serine peptidase [Coriobacteriia bacterium]|nr:S8 family serine peptidase [Coriobacteriia bacterium]
MLPRLKHPSLRLLLSIALLLSLAVTPFATASSYTLENDAHAPDRILVGFKPGTPAWDIAGAHANAGTKARGRIGQIDVEIVSVPKGRTVAGLIKAYEKNPNVEFVEPDHVMQTMLTPDDPIYPKQWAHAYTNTPDAWDVTAGSDNVVLAVLDTGLAMGHPEIASRVIDGYDFVNNDADPTDDNTHGTLVTGVAAATGNNAMGVAGMDWNARIMPVKVLNSSGSGSTSTVANGITYAADHGAQVINMSLGGSPSSTLEAAVRYAYEKGVTLVAASGNDGAEIARYPAAYPEVIAVGSVYQDTLSTFSNSGSHLAVVAPGERIDTIGVRDDYWYVSGTSAASPFVAGLAALLHAAKPGISPDEVRTAITATARDLGDPGWDKYYGWGHIDAAAAVAYVGGTTPLPAPEEPVAEPEPAPEPEPQPSPQPEPEPAPEPVDTTAPSVGITSPSDGAAVSGLVAVQAEASDEIGVVRVEFYANGVLIGTSPSAPYSTNWNTKKLKGAYALTAIAYDAAGNAGVSATVNVTVGEATKKAPPGKSK